MPVSPYVDEDAVDVYRNQIYQALRNSFIGPDGDSTFRTDDASIRGEPGVFQALLWASATAMAMAKEQLERAGANRNPATATELLALLERDYQVAPPYNATIEERQAYLAARAAVAKGASADVIEEALSNMLGEDFVAYQTVSAEAAELWPASPGDVGVFDAPNTERKTLTILDPVSTTGVEKAVRYELIGGSNPPIAGERFCFDPNARSPNIESVEITSVTDTHITATFTKPHNPHTLACRPHPIWLSSKRYNIIVLKFAAATDESVRHRVNEYMSRALRGVSQWCIVSNEGSLLLGHQTRARLGATLLGSISTSGIAAGFAHAVTSANAVTTNEIVEAMGEASAATTASGVGRAAVPADGLVEATTDAYALSQSEAHVVAVGQSSAETNVSGVGDSETNE